MSWLTLHPTQLGKELRRSKTRTAFACAGPLAVVGLDLALATSYLEPGVRALFAVTGLLWLYAFSQARLDRTMGLDVRPLPSWSFWKWRAPAAVVLPSVLLLAIAGAAHLLDSGDEPLWPFRNAVTYYEWWLKQRCLELPPIEELLYRVLVCVPLAALAGPWVALVVSSALYFWLHHAFGIAGLESGILGVVLAWIFLKSESVALPILVNAGANLLLGAIHRAVSSF